MSAFVLSASISPLMLLSKSFFAAMFLASMSPLIVSVMILRPLISSICRSPLALLIFNSSALTLLDEISPLDVCA